MNDRETADSGPNPYNHVEGIKQRALELDEPRVARLIERAENRILEDGEGYSIGYPDEEDAWPSYEMEMFFHLGILTGAALEREYPAGNIQPFESGDDQ